MIQLGIIFCTIVFIMNAVNQEGKKGREGVGWEATLNQGGSPSFPDTCHVYTQLFYNINVKYDSTNI